MGDGQTPLAPTTPGSAFPVYFLNYFLHSYLCVQDCYIKISTSNLTVTMQLDQSYLSSMQSNKRI